MASATTAAGIASSASPLDQLKQLLTTLGLYQKMAELGVKKAILMFILALFGQQTIGRKLMDRIKGLPPGPLPMPVIGTYVIDLIFGVVELMDGYVSFSPQPSLTIANKATNSYG